MAQEPPLWRLAPLRDIFSLRRVKWTQRTSGVALPAYLPHGCLSAAAYAGCCHRCRARTSYRGRAPHLARAATRACRTAHRAGAARMTARAPRGGRRAGATGRGDALACRRPVSQVSLNVEDSRRGIIAHGAIHPRCMDISVPLRPAAGRRGEAAFSSRGASRCGMPSMTIAPAQGREGGDIALIDSVTYSLQRVAGVSFPNGAKIGGEGSG